jgi:hypothetical protein
MVAIGTGDSVLVANLAAHSWATGRGLDAVRIWTELARGPVGDLGWQPRDIMLGAER